MTQYLLQHLKLKINEKKSAIAHPWNRTFLGFTFTHHRPNRRKVSEKAMQKLKQNIRHITSRTRGNNLHKVIGELGRMLTGWKAYYAYTQVPSPLKSLDKWIRRKLRCYVWKQWARKGYRELCKLGVDSYLAWNTAKSAHGPWRLSKSPALCLALPDKYFKQLGLPMLADGLYA